MTTRLKFRRGTTNDNILTTLEEGEIFLDTEKYILAVHDGVNGGGNPLASEAYVDDAITDLTRNTPNDLNTLEELANAIDNDSNFSGTIQLALDSKIILTDLSATGDLSYDSSTGVFSVTTYKSTDFDVDFANKSTSDLAEGSNLYYSDSLVDSHLAGGTGVTYSAGAISIGQAVETTSDVAFNSVTLAQSPSSATDATNKAYVDSVGQGVTIRDSARAATTQTLDASYSSGTLTGNTTGEISVDAVTGWQIGERIVVKDQVIPSQNGIYQVTASGDASNPFVLDRTLDMDESGEIPGAFVFVSEGTENAGTSWSFSVEDAGTFTLDTDDIEVYQFSKAGEFSDGAGLTLTGTQFSVNAGEGLTISSDIVQLSSQVAGTGLAYDTGVLSVTLNNLSTTNLTEGDNLYFTTGRANTAIDQRVNKAFVDNLNISAGELDGNTSAFYLDYNNFTNTPTALSQFTNDTDYIKLTDLSASGDVSYNSLTGEFIITSYKTSDFNADFANKTTDDLAEGTRLFFTEANIDGYLSSGVGVDYSSGVISIGQPVSETDDVTFNKIITNEGIIFGGDVSAATTLDDYEEGDWEPEFDSANSATGRETTVFYANYTKVGRLVTCNFSAELAFEGTGGSGQLVIKGLPFAGVGTGSFTPSYFENLVAPVSFMSGTVQAGAGRVLVSITETASTSMNAAPEFTDFVQAGTRIDGTVIYFVD